MSYNKIPYRATVQFSVFKLNLQTCIKVNIKIIDSIHPQTNIIKAFFYFFKMFCGVTVSQYNCMFLICYGWVRCSRALVIACD